MKLHSIAHNVVANLMLASILTMFMLQRIRPFLNYLFLHIQNKNVLQNDACHPVFNFNSFWLCQPLSFTLCPMYRNGQIMKANFVVIGTKYECKLQLWSQRVFRDQNIKKSRTIARWNIYRDFKPWFQHNWESESLTMAQLIIYAP